LPAVCSGYLHLRAAFDGNGGVSLSPAVCISKIIEGLIMAITFELPDFPCLNQNHEPSNPYPDVNAGMDCVPTSIAAALTWFTGTQYYFDELIDAVYPSGYTESMRIVGLNSSCVTARFGRWRDAWFLTDGPMMVRF
jgi:hypothetical protein